jgi:hypothetical protein
MAKAKSTTTTSTFRSKIKTKRPGVHSKKKASRGKTSKNYKKSYRGQGR